MVLFGPILLRSIPKGSKINTWGVVSTEIQCPCFFTSFMIYAIIGTVKKHSPHLWGGRGGGFRSMWTLMYFFILWGVTPSPDGATLVPLSVHH